MLSTADALAHLNVQDARGANVELASLWRDKPAVLAFVRHFGWLHCREHVVQLHRAIGEIHAAGGELFVIGNGTPNFIDGFRDTTGFHGDVYTDPSLAAYEAAQLERGLFKTVNVSGALASLGALRRGFRQGRTQGDQTQQGGVVVVAPGGRVLYHHVSHFPGDNAKPDEIVRAMRQQR